MVMVPPRRVIRSVSVSDPSGCGSVAIVVSVPTALTRPEATTRPGTPECGSAVKTNRKVWEPVAARAEPVMSETVLTIVSRKNALRIKGASDCLGLLPQLGLHPSGQTAGQIGVLVAGLDLGHVAVDVPEVDGQV